MGEHTPKCFSSLEECLKYIAKNFDVPGASFEFCGETDVTSVKVYTVHGNLYEIFPIE